jgi:DNA repair protein RecO
MSSELRSANVFVLTRTDYRDKDLIIRAAVEDHGLCAFIARGARGSLRRYGGALDVLVPSTMTFRPADSGLGQVRDATRNPGPEPDPSDIAAFAVRCYGAELLLASVEENSPTRYPYRLMRWVHSALSEVVPRERAKMRALWVLNRIRVIGLHREGRLPDLHRCSDCQAGFLLGEGVVFSRERGILCGACGLRSGESQSMLFGHLMELRELYAGGVFAQEWCSREISIWLEQQVREALGKALTSGGMLKSLGPPGADVLLGVWIMGDP